MGGGGNQTASTTDTSIGNIKIQTSIAGTCVTLAWGRTKIPANLMWYGGFRAIPHTSNQNGGGGGKGGGGQKPTNTTYTYAADCIMGLCEGPVRGVTKGWREKLVYGGVVVNASTNVATETITVPASTGNYTVADASVYVAPVSVIWRGNQVTSDGKTYVNGSVLGDNYNYSHDTFGGYAFAPDFRGGTVEINYIVSDAFATPNALPSMGLSLAGGWDRQPTWGYLTTNYPSQALGYSGLAYLYASSYDLGSDANVGNHNFELSTYSEFSAAVVDALPSVVIADFLTNPRYGAQWPGGQLGDLTALATQSRAYGLFMSPALTTQQDAASWLTYFLQLANADCTWSEGKIKVLPLGDTAATGNGVTFTPNTTPVFDLGEDHYLATAGNPPLIPHNKSASDTFNHLQLEFYDRANSYNTQIAEWKDEADIATRGLLTAPVIEGHAICDAGIAKLVVTLLGQRQIAVARKFTFTLPWTFSMLEPLDLVTLTESVLGFLRVPVRINQIQENEDYSFEIEAEDCPIGMASAPAYGIQQSVGFQHDYNAEPGNVATPFFFEPPINLTTSGLEVWCAASGQSPSWGGCVIYTSLDGVNYKQTGRIDGGCRYGPLTAAAGAGGSAILAVALAGLGGAFLPASAADAATDNSLLAVGTAAGVEFIDYQAATLTGANRYTLGTLSRGRYGTAAVAHAAGETLVRVDGAIGKSDALDLSMIGRTLFIKLCSFNVYGGGQQSIAEVLPFAYTITGAMAKLPPSDVAGFTATAQPFAIRLAWSPIPDQDLADYELRSGGTSWESATFIDRAGGTSYQWPVRLATAGLNLWVKARDAFGNYSRNAASTLLVVPPPAATSATSAIVGPNIRLDWLATTGAYAIDHYLISAGPSTSAQTVFAQSLTTRFEFRAAFVGTQFFGIAGVDVAGNVGPFVYAQVDIAVPGPIVPGNASHPSQEVIDNNVLLYWTAGASTLPIDRYLVRKGASFAGGGEVGSNGNSTFTTVFEQQSGTNTYWIAPVDTAGNQGPATPITATVNQPPDYLLRSSIDTAFVSSATETATVVGMYVENGRLYGPSLGQTYDAHFTSRSWATPNDQINAGSPLFFEPSGTSGSWEDVIDYGAVLPGTTVTVTPTVNQLAGATTVTVSLAYKATPGDPWTTATPGATSVFAANFRFVRVHVDFVAAGGDDLVEVSALNIKLAVKLKTASGLGYANASDAGGTVVAFPAASDGSTFFIQSDTPVIQPSSTTARIGITDFDGSQAFPTSFKAFLFDTNGNRVSGPFSWTARGY